MRGNNVRGEMGFIDDHPGLLEKVMKIRIKTQQLPTEKRKIGVRVKEDAESDLPDRQAEDVVLEGKKTR